MNTKNKTSKSKRSRSTALKRFFAAYMEALTTSEQFPQL